VVVNSLQEALDKAEDISFVAGHEEVMVIGGAEIYEQALLQVDRLYITHVHAEIEGDAFFPRVDWHDWQECKRENYNADPEGSEKRNPFAYSFVVYDRIK
jgi:dihydrofolate reductase